jgi:hypothetical protein
MGISNPELPFFRDVRILFLEPIPDQESVKRAKKKETKQLFRQGKVMKSLTDAFVSEAEC